MFEKSVPVKQSLGGPQLLSIGIYVRFNKRTTARILRMGPMQSFLTSTILATAAQLQRQQRMTAPFKKRCGAQRLWFWHRHFFLTHTHTHNGTSAAITIWQCQSDHACKSKGREANSQKSEANVCCQRRRRWPWVLFFLSAQQYTLNSHGYFSSVVKEFPLTAEERAKYINFKTNRTITPFQFKVYDLCAQVLKVGFWWLVNVPYKRAVDRFQEDTCLRTKHWATR